MSVLVVTTGAVSWHPSHDWQRATLNVSDVREPYTLVSTPCASEFPRAISLASVRSALTVLRAHGLCDTALQAFYRSVVFTRLLYACSARLLGVRIVRRPTATNNLQPTRRTLWFLSNWCTAHRGTCVWHGRQITGWAKKPDCFWQFVTPVHVVTLKLRKEYLNTVTYNTSVLLWIKNWTVWYIERYPMSTYTGVTNF